MNPRERFYIALSQIMVLVIAIVAITILAADNQLPPGTASALLGVVLTHAGITAYNGATKGGERSPASRTRHGDETAEAGE